MLSTCPCILFMHLFWARLWTDSSVLVSSFCLPSAFSQWKDSNNFPSRLKVKYPRLYSALICSSILYSSLYLLLSTCFAGLDSRLPTFTCSLVACCVTELVESHVSLRLVHFYFWSMVVWFVFFYCSLLFGLAASYLVAEASIGISSGVSHCFLFRLRSISINAINCIIIIPVLLLIAE